MIAAATQAQRAGERGCGPVQLFAQSPHCSAAEDAD